MSSFLKFCKSLMHEISRMKKKTWGQLVVYLLKSVIVFGVVIASQIFMFFHKYKEEIIKTVVATVIATVFSAWLL